jgi:hypothetical protein
LSVRTCGDGELNADKGEQCEPPNLDAGCTEECYSIDCPTLPFDVEGGMVEISNGGTYPSTATYACDGGDPPSDGDAERICQTDGCWTGAEPTDRLGDLAFQRATMPCDSVERVYYLVLDVSFTGAAQANAEIYVLACVAYAVRPTGLGLSLLPSVIPELASYVRLRRVPYCRVTFCASYPSSLRSVVAVRTIGCTIVRMDMRQMMRYQALAV